VAGVYIKDEKILWVNRKSFWSCTTSTRLFF